MCALGLKPQAGGVSFRGQKCPSLRLSLAQGCASAGAAGAEQAVPLRRVQNPGLLPLPPSLAV